MPEERSIRFLRTVVCHQTDPIRRSPLSILILAFLIGIIAGLRALMAPAVACWGAGLGWFSLAGTPLPS